ncbi:unnamed protein product [Linum trigynum]|uniref:Uncharacterized protein n=1 Tax=Linum trigynum TaxID=586398 RepID=A0AAV2E6X9_9ROSI
MYFMHSMVLEEDSIQLGSVVTQTFAKASASQDRFLVCGLLITALARYYKVDIVGMTVIRGPTPLGKATLRNQHFIKHDGPLTWIKGLLKPHALAPAGADEPKSTSRSRVLLGGVRCQARRAHPLVVLLPLHLSRLAPPRCPLLTSWRPLLVRTSSFSIARSTSTPFSIGSVMVVAVSFWLSII